VKQEENAVTSPTFYVESGKNPRLTERNMPFSDSMVIAQLNDVITTNRSNYGHYLTTEV
jgi:hypothetical protein